MTSRLIAQLAAGLLVLSAAVARADDAKVTAGARVYQNYCATCHGEELQNNTNVSFDLRRLRADEEPRFVNSVLNGKNAMPSWKGVLDESKIEALWAYVRANAYE
ncbi:MAG TPA: cytochrome c [Xanthobacteraceae bacterium]|nr:cytochrome c [Xanthobacteraceae bacterium]